MAAAAILLRAIAAAPARRLALEWYGAPFHGIGLRGGRPRGRGGRIRDFRPGDGAAGGAILAGAFTFGGETLTHGPGGDPWNRPCPSQRFAAALHGFGWLADLLARGEAGADEALRLTLAWRRQFGRWRGFAWDGEILRRRVIVQAAALAPLSAVASDAEGALLARDLSRQSRHLLALGGDPARAAERAAAAAIAGCALGGPGPVRLRERALRRLERRLPDTVPPDGVHASGSPTATLELLFDLLTLDDALTQLGRPPPEELSRAIDRLTGAVRFLTLPDGRLAALNGGADAPPGQIAAALAHEDTSRAPQHTARDSQYYRLDSPQLSLLAHAGGSQLGAWSTTACAQPAAIEIVAAGRRLISSQAWAPGAPPAWRRSDGGSCATVDGVSPAQPLTGFAAWALGPWLDGPRWRSVPRRSEGEGVSLLEVSHDAWMARLGVRVERRLYLDGVAAELRGEERFIPTKALRGDRRRFVPFAIRFHLYPGVRASVARDGKSVLIRHGAEDGWWLRTDAAEVALAPSQRMVDGDPRGGEQIVLSGAFRLEAGGRVRWKLARG